MGPTDGARLLERLTPATAERIEALDAFVEIDSTNSFLMRLSPPSRGCFHVALAGRQTEGRGRFEKRWHSPFGSGLYLSVAYSFENPPTNVASLSLAAGVAMVTALKHVCVEDVRLKWPNDLVLNDGKLGGILAELQPHSEQRVTVIVGTGINIDLGDEPGVPSPGIGRIAELAEVLEQPPDPLELATPVLEQLVAALRRFDAEGFEAFVEAWRGYDWLAGKAVRIVAGPEPVSGIAAGIDYDGALLVERDGQTRRIVSGSVIPVDEQAA